MKHFSFNWLSFSVKVSEDHVWYTDFFILTYIALPAGGAISAELQLHCHVQALVFALPLGFPTALNHINDWERSICIPQKSNAPIVVMLNVSWHVRKKGKCAIMGNSKNSLMQCNGQFVVVRCEILYGIAFCALKYLLEICVFSWCLLWITVFFMLIFVWNCSNQCA